jgi:uncharacterized protein YrrD
MNRIKVSELLGKPVIALSGAEYIGTAIDIVFDTKTRTAKFLKICCDDDAEPEFQFIELRHARNLAADAIMITGRHLVKYAWNQSAASAPNPINCVCYNQDGKLLGTVRDVYLENSAVKSLLINDAELKPALILSQSHQYLIINDTKKPVAIKKPKPLSVPKVSKNQIVKIHETVPGVESPAYTADPTPALSVSDNKEIPYPVRVPPAQTSVSRSPAPQESPGNNVYAFLIGKTVSREIRDDNGKVIIKAGKTIDDEAVAGARLCGKLVQLALYAD